MTSGRPSQTYGQGRYEVKEVLGRGIFSTVFKAYDAEADKLVALKVLGLSGHDRDIAEAMFEKEVGALIDFNHPGVVRLLDRFIDRRDGAMCIALELVQNAVSLDTVIREVQGGTRKPLDVVWSLAQLKQLISALDHAHGRRVIHRDVKPANVLMGTHAGVSFTKLADFGIARLIKHYGQTQAATLPHFATLPYAPPEQVERQETTAPGDYYSFGVTLLSVLTMQLPQEQLMGDALDTFLEPLRERLPDPENRRIIEGLARDLLKADPQDRPRPNRIANTLDHVLARFTTRPRTGLKLTNAVRDKIERAGMSVVEFFEDLNESLMARYQEPIYQGTKKVNVEFLGKSVWVLSALDNSDNERIVAVDMRVHQPDIHRRRRDEVTYHACPYELVEGNESAYGMLNESFEHYQRDLRTRERYESKQELIRSGRFILDHLENSATELVLAFRNENDQQFDDLLTVEVLEAFGSGGNGAADAALDIEVLNTWLSGLDPTTVFSLEVPGRRRPERLGSLRDYNPYTRELTLRLDSQQRVPSHGRIACQNVAQLASTRRQRIAVDKYLGDETVNPQLAELLLRPGTNELGPIAPISLFQALEPQQEIQDIVERALAARDFFLIQGPPGTGKTTIIGELVLQIISEQPDAKILLTAQANPAVDNAMDRVRALNSQLGDGIRTLRLTRSQRDRGVDEFEDSFSAWIAETRTRSAAAAEALLPDLDEDSRAKVTDALAQWRERLSWAEDVKLDYAQSVQVFGVTCLRTPTLWELLRSVEFDWVIIDEAAKATDTELLVPLVHGKRFLLVGDQKQLPPYLDSDVEAAMRFEGFDLNDVRTSLFEKIFDLLPPSNKSTLRRQYRMHPTIGDFVGRLFYSDIGGLENGVTEAARTVGAKMLDAHQHRVLWMNVPNGAEERESQGTSFLNRSEALRINGILELLNADLSKKDQVYTVGVITPYAAQVELLKSEILPSASKLWSHLNIEVSTVDAFQGREVDIAVYSLVRTTPGSFRFVEDERRLNVSFSRPRLALLIFGNKAAAESSSVFRRAMSLLPPENFVGGA